MSHIFNYYGAPFRVPPHTTIYWAPGRSYNEQGIPPGFSTDESLVRSHMIRDGVANRLFVSTIQQQPDSGVLTITVRHDADEARAAEDGPPLAIVIGAGEWGGSQINADVAVPYGFMETLSIAFTNDADEYSAPVIEFGLCYDPPA